MRATRASSESASHLLLAPSQSSSKKEARGETSLKRTDRTVTITSTTTNVTFYAELCNLGPTTTILRVVATFNEPRWFQIPDCIKGWTSLTEVYCSYCKIFNFTALPSSLTVASCIGCKGTWTQAEADSNTPSMFSRYFDWNWISNLPSLKTISILDLRHNGTLPNHLTHLTLESLTFSGSSLVGTVSPSFFVQFPALRSFQMGINQLTGTIPNYGLEKMQRFGVFSNKFTHWPPLVSDSAPGLGPPTNFFTIDLSFNLFVQIPSESDFQSMQYLQSFHIYGNPTLSGPFPRLLSNTTSRAPAALLLSINANGCNWTGPLPEIPPVQLDVYRAYGLPLSFRLYDNRFTGTIPESWSGLSFSELELKGNPGLEGTLATVDSDGRILTQFVKTASRLTLGPANFTGPMFNISTMNALRDLDIQGVNIDFCASLRNQNARPFSSGLSSCNLLNTTANQCAWAFPTRCRVDPVNPNFIVPQPIPPSPLPEPTCPLPAPGPMFECIGTQWVATGTVIEPVIILPPSSMTIVKGDLNTSSIVITSVNTNINVTGCVTSADGSVPPIRLTLSQEDLEKIVKNGGTLTSLLIQQSPSCGSLESSELDVDTESIDSCRTIKVDKIASSSGLSAVFTVNSSKCNVWWIVLISVLFFVALVAVIVVIVVFKRLTAAEKDEARSKLQNQ